MVAAVETMHENTSDFAKYSTMKVDVEVLPLAGAAAKLDGKRVQDWVSDLINVHASKVLKRKPITRKPPKPRDEK